MLVLRQAGRHLLVHRRQHGVEVAAVEQFGQALGDDGPDGREGADASAAGGRGVVGLGQLVERDREAGVFVEPAVVAEEAPRPRRARQ